MNTKIDDGETTPMDDPLREAAERFAKQAPAVDYWSVRLVATDAETLTVRQDILEPPLITRDYGAMVTIADRGGLAYAATADLSTQGLADAARQATRWARHSAHLNLLRPTDVPQTNQRGRYCTPTARAWDTIETDEKLDVLRAACRTLGARQHIVDWEASLFHKQTRCLVISAKGGDIDQSFSFLLPGLAAVANRGAQTQRRTYGFAEMPQQGGMERLDREHMLTTATRIADEAVQLLEVPPCPTQVMDLLLLPAQMHLQIHESIGHPLEIDRILGDERNYAGGSFVTAEMFGRYRYGSELLNVTFDPLRPTEAASYGFDDEGTRATRSYLIRRGILERGLGGTCSQRRASLPGVASARASGWNRPPIDRMANLNIEPGERSLDELVAHVEYGVLMDTNRSWSIDDHRNKFQFSCEYGRLIRDGKLGELVRNPGYRGISASFWRNLVGVGNETTWRVLGLANCGKGEPNQAIWVGHATPACLFRNVEVFGGASR